MKIKYKELFIGSFILIAVVFMGFIILEIPKIKQELKQNVQDDMVRTISSMVDNFQHQLHRISEKYPSQELNAILEADPQLRLELENQLSVIAAADIKYIYVLFKDEKGKFRFMLDGATQNKMAFGKKFDIESDAWLKAYSTQKPQLIEQKELSLWITYLQPIVIDGKVQGIVATDFSLEGHRHILQITQPLEKYLWIFLILVIAGAIVSSLQYFFYRLSKKRIYIDPLTSLYNRNFLNDLVESFDYQKYAIAMLDLDKFKQINDTYGHGIGDIVLQSIASELKSSIREYDKLIRYGGEEFILFISMRDADEPSIKQTMERIRSNIESLSIQNGPLIIKPTISIGLITHPSHFKSLYDAISMADKMLYQAKQAGRNRVISYSPGKDGNQPHNYILNVHNVKEAIEENRIFCEYQPIIDLGTNEIVGYEALVRIKDREGKVFYPTMFLPSIAHSSVYKELTYVVLKLNFQKVHETKKCISINLNITDFLDNDIYKTIIDHLNQFKEEARYFTFELLEEEEITDPETLKNRTETIQNLGAKISLDDFGTGYSNFSHIFSFSIDVIKIDGSLIRNIDTSSISRKLVESIVAFAHASNKRIVAEYIHSEKIQNITKELGITYGQGFYLAKPSQTLIERIDCASS